MMNCADSKTCCRSPMYRMFQLKELDSDDIFCVVGSSGELGSGASSVVRLAIQGAFGYVAVKCFNVHGGDQDKRKIVKK